MERILRAKLAMLAISTAMLAQFIFALALCADHPLVSIALMGGAAFCAAWYESIRKVVERE